MDMRMGGVDGLEATRRIRALSGSRGRVPIVAVTANAFDQHAEECGRAGMSGHLAKPFTQAELLAAVARGITAAVSPASCETPAAPVDAECLAQLTTTMGGEAVQRLLNGLALRIEALLRKLGEPVPTDELAELVHELVGSGGTLGFVRLASTAARFEHAIIGGNGDLAEMRDEALAALSDLRGWQAADPILTR
jgi:DNA-binding response OmpR family regulator